MSIRKTYILLFCISSAIGMFFFYLPGYIDETGWYGFHFNQNQEHLTEIEQQLIKYKQQNGKYPENDEGLAMLQELKSPAEELFSPETNRLLYEIQSRLIHVDTEIMTQWLVPFVYENRTGLKPDLFKDSPAGNVHGISIKVDNGIFVYSPALIVLDREYQSLLLKMYSVKIASLILPVFFLILLARSIANREPGKLTTKIVERLRIILIIMLPICAGLFLTQGTCYIRTIFNTKQKHPEMAAEYVSLLNKYRDNGVITEATYQKRLKIIRDLSK